MTEVVAADRLRSFGHEEVGAPSRVQQVAREIFPLERRIADPSLFRYLRAWDAKSGQVSRSVVYAIWAVDDGIIKIGYTQKFRSRLSALRCGSPSPLLPLLHIPGGEKEEESIHLSALGHRSHGEWFRVTAHVVGIVRDMAAMPRGFCFPALANFLQSKPEAA